MTTSETKARAGQGLSGAGAGPEAEVEAALTGLVADL
jgi:hypothetical protein